MLYLLFATCYVFLLYFLSNLLFVIGYFVIVNCYVLLLSTVFLVHVVFPPNTSHNHIIELPSYLPRATLWHTIPRYPCSLSSSSWHTTPPTPHTHLYHWLTSPSIPLLSSRQFHHHTAAPMTPSRLSPPATSPAGYHLTHPIRPPTLTMCERGASFTDQTISPAHVHMTTTTPPYMRPATSKITHADTNKQIDK